MHLVLPWRPPVCEQWRFTTLKYPSTLLVETVTLKEPEGFFDTNSFFVLPKRLGFLERLTTNLPLFLERTAANDCKAGERFAKGHF